jgi:membrane fusion protein (multidrug efflux system)
MSIRIKWVALALGLLALGGGVGRAIVARKAQQAELAQTSAGVAQQVITLQARDVWAVAPAALSQRIAVSGSLTAQRSAFVKARVAGELLKLSVREGDRVKAGQLIGHIDTSEFDTRLQQARQQADAAKAQWQIAQQTLTNNQALVQQGFISRNALDTSASNAAATRASFDAAQSAVALARKALSDTEVRAPLAGLVSQRLVQAGERVGVDARLIEIVDLASLELQAPLSPADVAQVKVGTPASLRIDGLPQPIAAHIARINPSASADTRAVMVYLALKSNPALRQGLFAQGELLLDTREALAVPLQAISRDAGHDEALRVVGEKVVRTTVTLGTAGTATAPQGDKTAALVEVLSGLKAGDAILADAAGTVHEGARVRLPTAP